MHNLSHTDPKTVVAITALRGMLRDIAHTPSATVADRTINMVMENLPIQFLDSSPFIHDWTASTPEWCFTLRIYGLPGERSEKPVLHVVHGDVAQLQRDAVLFRLACETA